MKRRRNLSSQGNQLKISRFFPVASNESASGCVDLTTKLSLSQSTKVHVPYCIDNACQLNTADTEKCNSSSNGLFKKLEVFHNSDADIEDYEELHKLLDEKGSSTYQLTSLKIQKDCHKAATNRLSNHQQNNLKLTPLEQQVVALKEKYSDLLLVVECGYKFQIFGEDAEKAAAILNMIAYQKNNFLSCSFPLHRLFIHVKKLVAHGCKVGVVRQKETTALKAASNSKHTPFKRELDMVYTKATFTEDIDTLSDSEHFIDIPLCMVFISEAYAKPSGTEVQIGFVAFLIQDGKVIYDHFQDDCARSTLDSRLTHLQPSEIILPDRNVSSQTANLIDQFSYYKSRNNDCVRTEFTSYIEWTPAFELLSKTNSYSCAIVDKLKDLPPVIHCCLAMAYNHLKLFKLEHLIDEIRNIQPSEAFDEILRLDGNSVRNLNLVPLNNGTCSLPLGSVFHVINRTRTTFGARLLRSWLLKPLVNRNAIEQRLDAVDWFFQHTDDINLVPIKKLFKSLQDLEKQLMSVLRMKAKPKEFLAACRSWEEMRILCTQLHSHFDGIFPQLVTCTIDVITNCLQGVTHYIEQIDETAVISGDKTKLFNNIETYPEMRRLTEKVENTEKKIHELKPAICRSIGLKTFNYSTVSGDEYLIEVKNSMLRALPSSWIKISGTKERSRFRSPEVQELFSELCRLRELLNVAADEAWLQFQRQVVTSLPTLRRANNAIATLDCLMALADVARIENYVRPNMVEQSGVLDITQGFHPVISRLVVQQRPYSQFVPNDTKLNVDSVRCMIVTGPNMGGKSSFLSQIGIIVVLAQLGSFVPASHATLSVFDSLFIRMGLHDEIYTGRSTFFVEMMEASIILKNSTARSLVIMDELGRGTGTHDGSAIAYATLKHLANQIKCLTLFVTHYPAVIELENVLPYHVKNYHMAYLLDSKEEGGSGEKEVVFLYTLTAGKCPKSFGLNVAQLAGLPLVIIEKAKSKAEVFSSKTDSQRQLLSEFKDFFH